MDVGNFISKKLPNLDVRDLCTCICIHLCTCWRISIGRSHFLPVFFCRLVDGDAYSRVHNSHTKSTGFYSAKLALRGLCLGQGVWPDEELLPLPQTSFWPFVLRHPSRCWTVSTIATKSTTWELWVKFYWGQNEDYSLGDSISESSEKLLPRGMGESQYMCDFSERGIHAIKHTFCRRLLFVKNRCRCLWFWCFSWCEEIGLIKPFPENN